MHRIRIDIPRPQNKHWAEVTCIPAYTTIGRRGLFTELLFLGEACVPIALDEPSANTL